MRLIDADALGIGRCSRKVLPAVYCAGWNGVINLIDKAPTVDAVAVVRCKDCEHARDLGFQFGSLVHESWFCIYNGPHTTGANDFCSHGQKREEGEIEDDP